jgi:hypothetical protein
MLRTIGPRIAARDRTTRAATAVAISGSVQRSWWAVEPIRRHAKPPVIDAGGKPPTDDAFALDRDHRGNYAGKIGMQGAAGIGKVAVVAAVMVVDRALPMVGDVLVMGVGGDRIGDGPRIGTR